MKRLRRTAAALLATSLSLSSTGVLAPSYAQGSSTTNAQAPANPPKRKSAKLSAGEKSAAAKKIGQAADALAKQRLASYVMARYGNAKPAARERFADAYASVSETDPSAEIHPFYLVSLGKKIASAPSIKEDGALFGAYAHVLLTIRDEGTNAEEAVTKRLEELERALKKAEEGKMPAKSAKDRANMAEVFSASGFDPWSENDVATMKKIIEARKIGPNTRYFRAYANALAQIASRNGSLSLVRSIPHAKQGWSLSCEANSMRDLVNFYRLGRGEEAAPESSFVFVLPADPKPPEYRDGIRYWADPDKTFVGRVDGKQSVNPQKLTGYGIHADGILPAVRTELKRYGYAAAKGTFDSNAIRDSLAAGHPVMFWYVMGSGERAPNRLDWKAPGGKSVIGYVGQHVGVIIGGKIGADGKLSEVTYVEGRSETPHTESFQSLSLKAKWFNEAIYVTERKKNRS